MNNTDIAKTISESIINSLHIKLSLKIAKKIIESAEETAKEINLPVTITIIDESGNLIAQHRMDDSILISITASFNKAYTALSLKLPTENIYELVQPGKPLYGLENIIPGKLCVFGGGIPIKQDEKIIGAIGVSGGTTDQDILIAKTALDSNNFQSTFL